MRRRPHRSVVRYEVKPPALFGWQTTESAVDQRNVPAESRPRSGYRSAPESVGMRRPRSFAGMRAGILIPNSVVYRLPPSRRINVFGSNLPAAKPLKSGSPNVLVLSTVSFMVGAALAQRFKIMVLVPAVATVLTVAVGIGATNAYTAWSIVVTAVIAATSMQIGYLIGMSIHGLLAGASSRSAPSTPVRHPAR